MPITTTPRKDGSNEPAYEMKVWSYAYAPIEYRNFFHVPDVEQKIFIVYQRRIVDNWHIEWVAPNSTWWNLWHYEQIHEIDDNTRVYLLVEMVRGKSP